MLAIFFTAFLFVQMQASVCSQVILNQLAKMDKTLVGDMCFDLTAVFIFLDWFWEGEVILLEGAVFCRCPYSVFLLSLQQSWSVWLLSASSPELLPLLFRKDASREQEESYVHVSTDVQAEFAVCFVF